MTDFETFLYFLFFYHRLSLFSCGSSPGDKENECDSDNRGTKGWKLATEPRDIWCITIFFVGLSVCFALRSWLMESILSLVYALQYGLWLYSTSESKEGWTNDVCVYIVDRVSLAHLCHLFFFICLYFQVCLSSWRKSNFLHEAIVTVKSR